MVLVKIITGFSVIALGIIFTSLLGKKVNKLIKRDNNDNDLFEDFIFGCIGICLIGLVILIIWLFFLVGDMINKIIENSI